MHGGLGVHLVLVHNVGEVSVNQSVHVVDWFELHGNHGLLLTDLLESRHGTTKGINILNWLINLELDLLDLISQVLKKSLGLLVQVTAEGVLP